MNPTTLRVKLAQELALLPEEHLPALYRLIRYFRLGLLTEVPEHGNGQGDDLSLAAVTDEFDPLDEAVARERAAFVALHPLLLAQYPGEEVAVYQGEVVDHDVDGVALSERIYQRFPNDFVWIAPVTAQPLEVITVYSHRLEP